MKTFEFERDNRSGQRREIPHAFRPDLDRRNWRLVAVAFLLGIVAHVTTHPGLSETSPTPVSANGWKTAQPDFSWQFPRDHWAHDGYRTEWWYFTGHLESDSGRRFGYQFTVFKVGLVPGGDIDPSVQASEWHASGLWMGHASISDLDNGTHRFCEVLHREIPLLSGFGAYPDPRLAWARGPAGTADLWTLDWNGEAFDFQMADEGKGVRFDLKTRPRKPLVWQGPNGYSRKGSEPDAASLYYSFTRLETQGTLEIDGETFKVHGQSWMDKEFGSNQLTSGQVGWDWFSLQLDDGTELMLYSLRRADGTVDFARGTHIDADGTPTYLDSDDWSFQARREWKSPTSDIRYPLDWQIRLGSDRTLTVRPQRDNQENHALRTGQLSYWEGAVEVEENGKRVGVGYVELTGYGEGNRPPI